MKQQVKQEIYASAQQYDVNEEIKKFNRLHKMCQDVKTEKTDTAQMCVYK